MHYQELFTNLEPATLVLTANRRLAHHLQWQYGLFKRTVNADAWISPKILPLTNWLEEVWDTYPFRETETYSGLLTEFQEQLIWENIIQAKWQDPSLLQLSATARLAREAWRLSKQWYVANNYPQIAFTEEQHAFYQWSCDFEEYKKSENCLDNASLPDELLNLFNPYPTNLPQKIYILGFDELTPQLNKFFHCLENFGCSIQPINFAIYTDSNPKLIPMNNAKEELDFMIQWAYNQYLHNPKHTIGCIVPYLDELRLSIKQKLTQLILLSKLSDDRVTSTAIFEIGGGESFKQFPLVKTAWLILQLCDDKINNAELSGLLHSPFLGAAEQERSARARLDKKLRQTGEAIFSIDTLLAIIKQVSDNPFCPILIEQLENLSKIYFSLKSFAFPSQWAEQFMAMLETMGWPGERALNSAEYQIYQRWLNLLDEFASLNKYLNTLSFKQASSYLRRLATQILFQPQSAPAPIQIISLSESAGFTADKLWIMGLHDGIWPLPPQPNPFLPREYQSALNMPRSSPERQWQHTELVSRRLQNSAKTVIFSYPCYNHEEILRPSPFIAKLPLVTDAQLALSYNNPLLELLNISPLETIADYHAPALSTNQKWLGGSRLFKDQAACPFKAFAYHRLHASPLESPILGLSAKERGILLHHALEKIWRLICNQQRLLELTDEQLKNIVGRVIQKILVKIRNSRPYTLQPQFLALEQQRLQELIVGWLKLEKNRPPFTVIATESSCEARLGHLKFTLRIDRIDQLEDGSLLLIDYKTGETSLASWIGERPDDPQLPLYCVIDTRNINGLSFANVRQKNMKFLGIAAQDLAINDITIFNENAFLAEVHTWPELKNQWQYTLTQLADQFCQGIAYVDPKDPKTTCRWCNLHLFCRIQSAGL